MFGNPEHDLLPEILRRLLQTIENIEHRVDRLELATNTSEEVEPLDRAQDINLTELRAEIDRYQEFMMKLSERRF